jgi:hypothetical protein
MNTTMKVTLLGAAASDALESGQVVSGVGGQYNFVAMSHALPDARSDDDAARHARQQGRPEEQHRLELRPPPSRATCATSSSPSTAWPTCAARVDSEVVKRLIAIADSRFQDELVREAKAHGKLEAGWTLPERYRHNLPQALDDKLHPWARPACCRTSRSAPT